MVNRVYRVEQVYLLDWFEKEADANGVKVERPVRIYPLTIKKFKQLAEILDQLNPPEPSKDANGNIIEEDLPEPKAFVDVLLEAVAFCMKTFEPELGTTKKLEDHIDMETMYYILDIAAGVKLNDPNLQAAVAAGTS
jgi:hypothetical protein